MTLHLHSCADSQPESVSGWRDIASAPSNGIPILVFGGRHELPEVVPSDGDWWRSNPTLKALPTHWMPLPDPPVTP